MRYYTTKPINDGLFCQGMKQGDHVKVIGRDGFYVFLKEVQGTATLRVGGAKSPDAPTLAIAINQVVSLETTELMKQENRRTKL